MRREVTRHLSYSEVVCESVGLKYKSFKVISTHES